MKLDYSLREKMNFLLKGTKKSENTPRKTTKIRSYLKTKNKLQMDEE